MATLPALFVSVGAGRHQVPVIEHLKRQGHRVAAFDLDAAAPGLALADHAATISTWDAPGAIAWLAAQKLEPDAIVCFSYGKALETQQALIRHWGLPGAVPCELSELSGDKRKLRTHLHRMGWGPAPVTGPDDVARVEASDLYIVKDRIGGSSRNVRQVSGRQLRSEAHEINWDRLVVEPWLEGDEYRIAAVVQDRRPIVANRLRRTPLAGTFLTGRLCSEPLTTSLETRLLDRLIQAHPDFHEGVVKIDSIAGTVVEIDFGIAGDLLESHMSDFGGGSDLRAASAALHLGQQLSDLRPVAAGCCIDFLYLPNDRKWRLDTASLQARAERLLGRALCVPLQIEGELTGQRRTNMDAIAGILHFRSDMSHADVNESLLSDD